MRAWKTALAIGVAAFALSACEPRVALRGNAPLESRMQAVNIGISTKRDVAQAIGTPSTVSTFDQNVWYYMSQRRETWAFYDDEVVEHQVLALHFDEGGVLREIEEFDETSLADVNFRDRETPTSGRTMSIMEQLFGNLGKVGDVSN